MLTVQQCAAHHLSLCVQLFEVILRRPKSWTTSMLHVFRLDMVAEQRPSWEMYSPAILSVRSRLFEIPLKVFPFIMIPWNIGGGKASIRDVAERRPWHRIMSESPSLSYLNYCLQTSALGATP